MTDEWTQVIRNLVESQEYKDVIFPIRSCSTNRELFVVPQ